MPAEKKNKSSFRFNMISCVSMEEIQQKTVEVLQNYQDFLPIEKDSLILLKPNFNSNMNALTGNTTDLRLLRAVILFLKNHGYTNIIIGEGTNSGFYRNKIGVMARLKVDRIADQLGVRVVDFNDAEPVYIELENHTRAAVAKEVFEAELFINMPKIKTHVETGMSVCMKNMVGCLIGQTHKKKVHENLPENILRLNDQIKPHLHIVDGLISMEGLGPGKGTPLRTDTIMVGTDPIFIDLACAELARFDYKKINYLALGEKKGLITPEHKQGLQALAFNPARKSFDPPEPGMLARFVHNPKWQKYFLRLRNTTFFNSLASTGWFGNLLVKIGLRQDVFIPEEMVCKELKIDKELCHKCGICKKVCPSDLDLPNDFKIEKGCIGCMYCYSVCPKHAIKFKGDLGFFREQIKQYDQIIRKLYA